MLFFFISRMAPGGLPDDSGGPSEGCGGASSALVALSVVWLEVIEPGGGKTLAVAFTSPS